MTARRFDVLALGNALVDVLAHTEEDFLVRQKLVKGSMQLIDEARAEYLYASMGPTTMVSGGSAANTIAGVASLGARGAFIGKVKADDLGDIFAHDLRSQGIAFDVSPARDGPGTGRCFILVTPDGERTMNTFLGAGQGLTAADVDEAAVAAASIVYLEGYLWDPPGAKEAFIAASKVAHASGAKVALTLSDSFCVDRYRAEFLELVQVGLVDILFANESELTSLYMTADFDTALTALRDEGVLAAVTRSEKGALVVTRDATVTVPAHPIRRLVDATGAGDLFAAGFLVGLTRGQDLRDAARLGTLAAAEVIQHMGPRPQRNLAELAAEAGLGA
jgi:sugar/nucleoside kinase (ribokinase family)